jgi:tRNA pseudouridine55 synthase
MDGVLVIDKPQGITSHDVVVIARRALGESRIGHTGTLDPLATGVLALACGQATRLVSFLTASDKEYLAGIRFGLTTDSYDVTGKETDRSGAVPSRAVLVDVLESLRGDYLQPPPPVSAKRIEGRRAYALARAGTPTQPASVPVRVPCVELQSFEEGVATVRIVCSAGFYVRALAHAAGERAGTGACLQALRRVRSGDFTLSHAVTIEELQRAPGAATGRAITTDRLLPGMPAAALTPEGLERVSHGRDIGPEHVAGGWPERSPWVRLTTTQGLLRALAVPGSAPRALHPSVVLS